MRTNKEIIERMIKRIELEKDFGGLCQILWSMHNDMEISYNRKIEIDDFLKSELLPYRILSNNPLRSNYFNKRNSHNYWWPKGDKSKRIKFLRAVLNKIVNQ